MSAATTASPDQRRGWWRQPLLAPVATVSGLGLLWLVLVAMALWPTEAVRPPASTPEQTPSTASAGEHGAGGWQQKRLDGDHRPSPQQTAPVATTPVAAVGPLLEPRDPARLNIKLPSAPILEVAEDTEMGPLPKRGENGQLAWQLYGRPALVTTAPKIAIVVTGLGLSRNITFAATSNLPPDVTLAFDAQSPTLGSWLNRARQVGFETLLDVPMEPVDFPRNDPGPGTLLTNLPVADNLERLLTMLKRGSGYVGITASMGQRFAAEDSSFGPILSQLADRGLIWFAPQPEKPRQADAVNITLAPSLRLDADVAPAAIDAALAQLVVQAKQRGNAIGVIAANNLTLERLNLWFDTLVAQQVVLVPLSALVSAGAATPTQRGETSAVAPPNHHE